MSNEQRMGFRSTAGTPRKKKSEKKDDRQSPPFITPLDINHLRWLPKGYPLAPSNCAFNLNEISLDSLVQSIDKCSKLLSLQSSYVDNKPISRILFSEEYGLIYLSIWRTGDYVVTVEIQRGSGDHYSFQGYAWQLLQAAHGEFPKISPKVGDIQRLMEAEKGLRVELASVKLRNQGGQMEPTATLHMACNLLLDNRPGSCQSGLEMLVVLSNPRKTNVAVSVLICRVMIMGTVAPGTESKEAKEMQTVFLNIIQRRQRKDADLIASSDSDSDDESDEEMSSPAFDLSGMSLMVMLALTVLDNSLEVFMALEPQELDPAASSHASLIEDFLRHAKVLSTVNLIFTLLTEIGKADENAHIARVATSCLRRLSSASKIALQETMRLKGRKVVEKAHAIGKSSHAKLEWECDQFLPILVDASY